MASEQQHACRVVSMLARGYSLFAVCLHLAAAKPSLPGSFIDSCCKSDVCLHAGTYAHVLRTIKQGPWSCDCGVFCVWHSTMQAWVRRFWRGLGGFEIQGWFSHLLCKACPDGCVCCDGVVAACMVCRMLLAGLGSEAFSCNKGGALFCVCIHFY